MPEDQRLQYVYTILYTLFHIFLLLLLLGQAGAGVWHYINTKRRSVCQDYTEDLRLSNNELFCSFYTYMESIPGRQPKRLWQTLSIGLTRNYSTSSMGDKQNRVHCCIRTIAAPYGPYRAGARPRLPGFYPARARICASLYGYVIQGERGEPPFVNKPLTLRKDPSVRSGLVSSAGVWPPVASRGSLSELCGPQRGLYYRLFWGGEVVSSEFELRTSALCTFQ